MISILFLLFSLASCEDYLAAIIYSPKTQYQSQITTVIPDLIEIEDHSMNFNLLFYEITDVTDVEQWTQTIKEKFIFDLSNDMVISEQIANFSDNNERIHFVFSREKTFSSTWSFFVYTKFTDYGKVILQLMQHFEWDRSTISV